MARSALLFGIAGTVIMASAVRAETVVLSSADCRKLVQHVPADGVTFQPGVGARGKAVAPADLGGGYNMQIPEEINIQIGIDLADRMGLRAARRQATQPGNSTTTPPVRKVMPYEGKAALGLLTIKGNDAFWNGERLVPQDEKLLAEACSKGLTAAGVPPEPPKK